MRKDKDLSKLFAKGQQLETSLSTSSLFSKDGGLHLMSYKVDVSGKSTIIDNISVYGNIILILESKNYTVIQGTIDKPFWRGKGTRNYFTLPSPIKQNQYHEKLLIKFLQSKGLKFGQFKIEHYVIVPDNCKVEVCEVVRDNLITQSELETKKHKLSFYFPEVNRKLSKIIKGGLF